MAGSKGSHGSGRICVFQPDRGYAGIAFVVSLALFFGLGGDDPDGDASGAEVVEWVIDNEGLIEFRLALTAVTLFVAGIFFVGLFGLLRARERSGEDYWSLVGLAGGILTAAMVGASAAPIVALVVPGGWAQRGSRRGAVGHQRHPLHRDGNRPGVSRL